MRESSTRRTALKHALQLGAALLAALVAVYAGALHGGFLWDDDSHVTANPCIVGPLGLKEVWTTPAANYFPLVLTNFWLQHAIWGLAPLGYHAVTLACHAIAALLLWRVLGQLRVPGAWVGAALWALHPVQVESVAWISELKNTQSAVFFLLAISCHLRWCDESPPAERQRPVHYACALLCALGALLSKPSTVMLPVVLALCVWWRRGRVEGRDLYPLAPFFLLSLAAAGWAIWEQKFHSGAVGAEWQMTLPERLGLAGRAVWFYLGKLVWPEPLVFIYPRWPTTPAGIRTFLPLAAALLAGLLLRIARARAAGFAALFFLALLFPVLGFFDIYFFRYSFVSDHFQYLASIGPLTLAGAGLARLGRWRGPAVSAAVLLACALLSSRQAAKFSDHETLWRTTLARNPEADMAWLNLGATLAHTGRSADALACFERVAKSRSGDPAVLNDAAWHMIGAGLLEPALPLLSRARELRPDYGETYNNLGHALRRLGRLEEAIAAYARLVALQPASAEARSNLGSALAEKGRLAEAIEELGRAVRLAPNYAPARANLGTALGLAGRWREAAAELRETVRLDPHYPEARGKLAVALAREGKLEESLPYFREALRLAPGARDVRRNFGAVLEALGRTREAAEQQALAEAPPVRTK